jgi:hypothetical protein
VGERFVLQGELKDALSVVSSMVKHIKIAVVMIALAALMISSTARVEFAEASPKTITVPDDYSTINAAIVHASAGDTVFVKSGNYPGGMVIDKPLSLVGEGASTTSIVGGMTASEIGVTSLSFEGNSENVLPAVQFGKPEKAIQPANFIPPLTFAVIVTSNDVTISGFTIRGGDRAIYSTNSSGLRVQKNSLGNVILGGSNNTVSNNSRIGLTVGGFFNVVVGNSGGVGLSCSNSCILENNLTSFEGKNANFNTVANNTLTGSNMGLYIGADGLNCSYNLFAG